MTSVIKVENLSKQYTIGGPQRQPSFREMLSQQLTAPFRWMKHGRKSKGRKEKIWALKDVSFEVKQGEIVGVIGRNGSGKSTLLKILSRITDPTQGRAEIHGRVASLLEVGTGFHPELTGRENIYLNGTILGMRRWEITRKFDEIVSFAEVEKFIDTSVKHYSSGMYVRLAFAVAAHLNPEILLVDEVLAVGDIAFQRKCLGKMGDVAKQGRTVLFVSHNMDAITTLCKRAVLLIDGHMGMEGVVDKTVTHFLSTLRMQRSQVHGEVLLDGHPGRLKKLEQLIRITHCKILDHTGSPKTFFKSGAEVQIIIGYESKISGGNLHPAFFVIFNDIMGKRIFSCSNEFVQCPFNTLRPKGEVKCIIPKLPIVPGNYTITLSCKVGPTWSDGVYDAVEIEVLSGDFFGTGHTPSKEWGASLVEHHWLSETK